MVLMKIAVRVYDKLITEDQVDAVIGPYSSPITDAVADVTEKHRKLLIAPLAGTTSLWEKGRKNLIMVISPVELTPEGFIDLAARFGLKTLAVLNEDGLVAKAAAKGAGESRQEEESGRRLLRDVPEGNDGFLANVEPRQGGQARCLCHRRTAVRRPRHDHTPNERRGPQREDVQQLAVWGLPDYQKRLEKSAEFVYSATFWGPSLPYPGNREFVAAYEKEFNRAPALQSANAYAGCGLFAEAGRRAGSVDSDKLRETLLRLRTKTILGDFAVDERGFQVAQKAVTTQWQDGKQVILWPDEIATGKLRFPTPPWSAR